MTDAELLKKLEDIFRENFDDGTITLTPATGPDDIEEWDSLEQINLLTALGAEFGIQLGLADIRGVRTVGDMMALVREKGGPVTGGLCLRLARQGEEEAIVQFLDAHWEWKLPLVHVPEFFEFYYRPLGAAPQFALAEQGRAHLRRGRVHPRKRLRKPGYLGLHLGGGRGRARRGYGADGRPAAACKRALLRCEQHPQEGGGALPLSGL